MKKSILFIMLLLILPMAFAYTSDFSRGNFQTQASWGEFGNIYTFNSYALRSVHPSNLMSYNEDTWGSCSIAIGGTDANVVPITYTETYSQYEHRSLIVAYNESIRQYGSDCVLINQLNITSLSYLVSNIGAIKGHTEDGYYHSPNFAYLSYTNITNTTTMYILALDSETSNLYVEDSVILSTSDDFSDLHHNFGVAGGCYSSQEVSCVSANRVFGVYNSENTNLYIVGKQSGNWLVSTQYAVGNTYMNDTTNNNILFYDDWDRDGLNEFIMLGARESGNYYEITNHRVRPLDESPYYVDIGLDAEGLVASGAVTINYLENNFQEITLCQVGLVQSELEVCFNVMFAYYLTGIGEYHYYFYTGFIPNDFLTHQSSYKTSGGIGATERRQGTAPFTYLYDGENIVCYVTSENVYSCYDVDKNLIHSFNTSHTLRYTTDTPLEVIMTELDGDTSTYEILFSDGQVETINWTGVNYNVEDLFPTYDTTYKGTLLISDISDDSKGELIYYDEDVLKIYSNDNTPFTFQNYTYVFSQVDDTNVSGSGTGSGDVTFDSDDNVFNVIQVNIKFIIGLIIIIALIVAVAQAGVSNPIVLMFVGIVGAIISAALALISTSVLIIILVSCVILIIMGLTIFKNSGGE